jgi:galactokinase
MSYFYDRFGTMPQVEATAPGQVNLIGEHTDYNGGFVLPLALPQVTTVELCRAADSQVVVTRLHGDNHADTCRYTLGAERRLGDWGDYVRGVTHILRGSGHRIGGFNALIRSAVPVGSSMASNAAFVVSLLRALRQAFRLELDDLTIAHLGQKVENAFVGANVGIIDPMASSIGRSDAALFLDTRDMTWRQVGLPAAAEVIVIHSGIVDRDAGPHTDARRQECEQAASALEVAQLRDLSTDDLPALAPLPPTLAKRARHVITENARVQATVAALEKGDLPAVGRLFHDSHRSMRDDYQITVPEVDLLVDLLRFEPSVYGARMTGGGFGGSVVALAEAGRGGVVAKKIARRYGEQSGRQPAIVLPI